MSFLNPLGLLGLLVIPILIIIYIIKNKYTEQLIPATYLWTLSERFLKRKNPIKRLSGLISLILQILAVVLISIAIARPVFYLSGQAKDYLFILDASGSMNIVQDGDSRFEIGKQEIKSIINDSAKGSSYSLICVGETTDKVFENMTEKRQALTLLSSLEASHMNNTNISSLSFAQEAFSENAALQIYCVTDKNYQQYNNIQLVNVSAHEENYAISDVSCHKDGGNLAVKGYLYAYENAASLDISIYVDGGEVAAATRKGIQVDAFNGENPTPFEVVCAELTEYSSVKVVIDNADALALDNQTIVYNDKSDNTYTTLIVSDESTFFLEEVFSAFANLNVTKLTTKEFENLQQNASEEGDSDTADFGLYVFDGYTPDILPRNSAVWFINPTKTLDHTGFSISNQEDFGNPPKEDVEMNDKLNVGNVEYSTSTATSVTELLQNTNRDDIKVAYYTRCDPIRDFRELMYCNNDPVLFAGTNDFGNRQVVFAFDLKDSNISVSFDFTVLTYNLLNYTFPEVVDETSYTCGETVRVNVLANVDSIRVETPNKRVIYLDTDSDVAEFEIKEVGVHTLTLTNGKNQSKIHLYCNLPMSERQIFTTENDFTVVGEAKPSQTNGIYDDLFILFMILAALFVADWTVYCYEQYQLR